MGLPPTSAHVLFIAARVHGPLLGPAAAHHTHHLGHESFDFAGLAAAAAASWFGIPGPGEPVLIAAGILAGQHRLALLPVLIVAWVAASAGGIAGWIAGRQAGRAVLTWRGPLRAMRMRAVARGEALFGSHPVVAILLTPSWIAGIHRAQPAVYLTINTVSAAVWAGGIGLGAYFAGPAVVEVVDDVGTLTVVLLFVLVAAVIAAEVVRRRRLRRALPPTG